MLTVDPADAPAMKSWQDRAAFDYAQYLQYFETDRLDLTDPNRSGGCWLRVPGVKLPPSRTGETLPRQRRETDSGPKTLTARYIRSYSALGSKMTK